MAKFFKRMKKDKKFRKNVFIGVIILLFLSTYSNNPQTQSFTPQPTCDGDLTRNSCEADSCFWVEATKSNTDIVIKGTTFVGTTAAGCWAGVAVGAATGGPPALITVPVGCIFGATAGIIAPGIITGAWDWFSGLFTSPCYSCIPSGYLTEDASTCCSGFGSNVEVESITGVSLLDKTSYVCYEPIEGDACRSWQKTLSKILDSVWKGNKIDSCETKAYISIGAGLFMLLALL